MDAERVLRVIWGNFMMWLSGFLTEMIMICQWIIYSLMRIWRYRNYCNVEDDETFQLVVYSFCDQEHFIGFTFTQNNTTRHSIYGDRFSRPVVQRAIVIKAKTFRSKTIEPLPTVARKKSEPSVQKLPYPILSY